MNFPCVEWIFLFVDEARKAHTYTHKSFNSPEKAKKKKAQCTLLEFCAKRRRWQAWKWCKKRRKTFFIHQLWLEIFFLSSRVLYDIIYSARRATTEREFYTDADVLKATEKCWGRRRKIEGWSETARVTLAGISQGCERREFTSLHVCGSEKKRIFLANFPFFLPRLTHILARSKIDILWKFSFLRRPTPSTEEEKKNKKKEKFSNFCACIGEREKQI